VTAAPPSPPGSVVDRVVVLLDEPPTLGALYARAARTAAAARLRRSGPVGALPEVTYRLTGVRPDPDRLTAYQHLIGEPGTDELPAGFVHVLAFPLATALMSRDDFPLPLLGAVHLANRVEQHRPLRLGETLDVRTWAQDLRPHRKGAQVDLVAEVRADGDVAWHGTSTYLAPGVRLGEEPPADAEPRPAFVAPEPTGRWRFDADAGRRYAAVSGDVNPIHLAALPAKALGFPRAIAHGMLTAARLLAAVGPARGDAFGWDVEFAAPVLLPSTPAVRVARDADGGFGLTLWDARRERLHVAGSVRARG
jgi:acyl dehydratase